MILMAFSVTVAPSSVHACDCAPPLPVAEEMERSTAVFAGKVIRISDKNKFNNIKSSADPIVVTISVEKGWKGADQTQIQVQTARSSVSCGFQFHMDEEYLVYARADGDGRLNTNSCDRTKVLSHAQDDVIELGNGTIPTEHVDLLEQPSYGWIVVFLTAVIAIVIVLRILGQRRLNR